MIHIEIDARDTVVVLRPRMFDYYELLRRQYGLPVLPIALYLRVGLDGIGWDVYEEKYWDRRLLAFEYGYVGLPGLEAETYLAGEQLLGVALTALMRVPAARRAEVHAEALRRLAEARENDYRRYLLLDCLEAYATLDEAQARELEALLRTERYQGTQVMAVTTFEKGVQQGLQQGQRTMLQEQLEARFGPLSPGAQHRLESVGPERLKALALELLKAQSLKELGLED